MINRKLCFVTAAAAMVAFAPTGARAQTNATTVTTSTTSVTTTEFTPISIVTIAPVPTGPNGEPIDFTALSGKNYDYMDLNQARRAGFSWHEIAVIAKISDLAGISFDRVKHQVLEGRSFPSLADEYNLRLTDVWDARDYEHQIWEYRLAYENSGTNDIKQLVAASQQERYMTPGGYAVTVNGDLADLVNSSPDLTMFARLVRRARLMKVLNDPGPYTVFAPTDAAFSKLSSDQINALQHNRSDLAKIIDYCIIPQRIDSAAAMAMTAPTSPPTLEGDTLQVLTSNGNVTVNGASVVKADIFATNGVIHEVDTLLVPASEATIVNITTTPNPVNTSPSPAQPGSGATQVNPAPAQ